MAARKRLPISARVAILAALWAALAVAWVTGGAATSYSEKVEEACRDDYLRLCAGYPLGSASLRLCMESKSKQISPSCIRALVDAGEVDRRRLRRGH